MKQNFNRSGSGTKKRGPEWKIKVGVNSPNVYHTQIQETETKLWEIKVILN